LVMLKQVKETLTFINPKQYELTYVHDFEKAFQRISCSGKLLNALYKRSFREPESLEMSKCDLLRERIRFSFKLCLTDIVSNKKTKKKHSDF
jgi:hypothetical protein